MSRSWVRGRGILWLASPIRMAWASSGPMKMGTATSEPIGLIRTALPCSALATVQTSAGTSI